MRKRKARFLSLRQQWLLQSLGVTVTRVMTDNWQLVTKPSLPRCLPGNRSQAQANQAVYAKTNGKAERFIQTALREWAYAQAYPTSDRRAEELPHWLHRYTGIGRMAG